MWVIAYRLEPVRLSRSKTETSTTLYELPVSHLDTMTQLYALALYSFVIV